MVWGSETVNWINYNSPLYEQTLIKCKELRIVIFGGSSAKPLLGYSNWPYSKLLAKIRSSQS